MTPILRIVGLALLLVTVACGGADKEESTDASTDSHVPNDAHVDSGHDSAVADSGFDANTSNDAAIDTSVADAGFDSGPVDAGFDACPGSAASATAAQVCQELCQGNVAMFCSGPDDGGCVGSCMTAHASKTASQLGHILACTQLVTSNMQCGAFGSCYTLAASCP